MIRVIFPTGCIVEYPDADDFNRAEGGAIAIVNTAVAKPLAVLAHGFTGIIDRGQQGVIHLPGDDEINIGPTAAERRGAYDASKAPGFKH